DLSRHRDKSTKLTCCVMSSLRRSGSPRVWWRLDSPQMLWSGWPRLPRYRRLAEPRSDHFSALFYRTSVQLRCPAAPPAGGRRAPRLAGGAPPRAGPPRGGRGPPPAAPPSWRRGSPGGGKGGRAPPRAGPGGPLWRGGGGPRPRPAGGGGGPPPPPHPSFPAG